MPTEDPKKVTLNSSGGGTSTSRHTYSWDAARDPIPNLNLAQIPWASQYDLGAAYNKWLAANEDNIPGNYPKHTKEWMQAAGQAFQNAAPSLPETFFAGVKPVRSAEDNQRYAKPLLSGQLDPQMEGGKQYTPFDANGITAEGRLMKGYIRAHLAGDVTDQTPEAQRMGKALLANYPGMTEKQAAKAALRDINSAQVKGVLAPALSSLPGAVYDAATLGNANNRINQLSAPNAKPAQGNLPQADLGLARQVGTAQQNANTGFSEMERRKLEEQNLRNFNGAAGQIQRSGDSSNIGANLAALYGKQQEAGVGQALASEQVRTQRQGELANLLGQQRQQGNAIAAAGQHQADMRNNQYNIDEFARRGDLNAAQMQKWQGMQSLAGAAGGLAALYGQRQPYAARTWDSDQAYNIAATNAQKPQTPTTQIPNTIAAPQPQPPGHAPYLGGPPYQPHANAHTAQFNAPFLTPNGIPFASGGQGASFPMQYAPPPVDIQRHMVNSGLAQPGQPWGQDANDPSQTKYGR